MELLKKNIHMSRRKSMAVNQITLEEDKNVPDTKPDVGEIIWQEAFVHLQESRPAKGQIPIKGRLTVKLLYVADDGEHGLHRLEWEIPFQEMIGLEDKTAGDGVGLRWEMEDVRIRRIHSRKLSLQALIAITAEQEELYDIQAGVELAGVPDLQTCTKEICPLSLAVQKRDTFRAKEEFLLPANQPNVGEVLWDSVSLEGIQVRVGEGELVVTGEWLFFLLYEGEEEPITRQWIEERRLFSAQIPCSGSRQEEIPHVTVTLADTSLTVCSDEDGEPRMLRMEAVLNLDIRLYQEICSQILTDIYAPSRELTPIVCQEKYESLILRNISRCRTEGRIRLEGDRPPMLQVCHGKGEVQIHETKITEKGILVEGAIPVHILYVTAKDSYPFAGLEGMIPFSHTIQAEGLDGDCRFTIQGEMEQLSIQMTDSQELEVKVSFHLGVMILRGHEEKCMVEVEEKPLNRKKIQKMPGLVAYLVQPGDTLWTIGKAYYTTPERIRLLNGMEREEVKPGDCLLVQKEIVLIE